jgi:hypothetical protein
MNTELNGDRAARLLFAFYKRHQHALSGPDLEATLLDVQHDAAASELCSRIAEDPYADFASESRHARAIFAKRIIQLLTMTMMQPGRWDVLKQLGPLDDKAATAALLVRVLARMKLPAEWHGLSFAGAQRGWEN